jgi:hypothetical protein
MRRSSRWFTLTIIILALWETSQAELAYSASRNNRVQAENASVLNVMARPYNARGDGNTDDLKVIQQAIYDCEGATPPSFPLTKGCRVYLPRRNGKCYLISKPLRVASGPIEIAGDPGSCIQKLYNGPTIINENWGLALATGPSLIGPGASISTTACTGTGCPRGLLDLSQFLNTSQKNLATSFAAHFEIEFRMEPTTTDAGNVLGSEPSTPGSGPGMFKFSFSSRKVSATVSTRPGIRMISDGVENGTTMLTSAKASFLSGDVGRTISGPGIPNYTTISLVKNGNTVILSNSATATATGVTLNIDGILVSLSSCPAQRVSTIHAMALSWDGRAYRLFQDGTLCSNAPSTDAPVLGPFEAMMIPDLGHFDYWMAGGVISDSFKGYLDEIRFSDRSLHTSNYTPATSRFPTTTGDFLLDPSVTSLDGTQLAYTSGQPVYLPVLGGATVNATLHLHDLELCADDGNPYHRGDGYFAQWAVGSEIDHVKCSNAVYAGLNFYNNDYGSYEHDNIVDGGMLGILHGVAWNGSLAQNDSMDVQSIACEMVVGDGGGNFHDIHEGCTNRGNLRYCKMYMAVGFASQIDYDGCDQEAGDTNYQASLLIYGPSAPMVFTAPDLSGVSGKPFIEQDGGMGPTIVGGQFQQGAGASQIIYYGSVPSSPTILINPQLPIGVPLSNSTGDPWVQVISNGTTSHPTLHLGTMTTNFSVSWANQDTITAALGASSLSVTLMNPSVNSIDYLQLCQDAVGSRIGTRFAIGNNAETLKWANDTPPTLTSTPSKCDRLKFAFDGVNLIGALDVGNF